jgi:hypothetical protein
MCKRKRPKFKQGDMLEEFFIDSVTNEPVIDRYLVVNVIYEEYYEVKYNSRRSKFPTTDKFKYRWVYELYNIRQQKTFHLSRRWVDQICTIKKVA